ncbi:uncharacterized protein LOC142220837 isoform X2 [Haematobia irritans]|uniref:uncharacterized protein LOC142220837 isoform X2 n=1 Tax=Haematobia irritans TaxID=7368 RepID=UPI003F508A85
MYTKNLPSLPPSFSCQSKRSQLNAKTKSIILALWVIVAVLCPQTIMAGVIKKRETPFTNHLRSLEAVTENLKALVEGTALNVDNNPDNQREVVLDKLTATLANLAETTTVNSISRVAQSMEQPITESSKEYQLNEIALNDTMKLLKSLRGDNNLGSKQGLGDTVIQNPVTELNNVTKATLETNMAAISDKKELENENTKATIKSSGQEDGMMEDMEKTTELANIISQLGLHEPFNESVNKSIKVIKDFGSDIGLNPLNNLNLKLPQKNIGDHENVVEIDTARKSNIKKVDDGNPLNSNTKLSLDPSAIKNDPSLNTQGESITNENGRNPVDQIEIHNDTSMIESLGKPLENVEIINRESIMEKSNDYTSMAKSESSISNLQNEDNLSVKMDLVKPHNGSMVQLSTINQANKDSANDENPSTKEVAFSKVEVTTDNNEIKEKSQENSIKEGKSIEDPKLENNKISENHQNNPGQILLDISSKENILQKLGNEEKNIKDKETTSEGNIQIIRNPEKDDDQSKSITSNIKETNEHGNTTNLDSKLTADHNETATVHVKETADHSFKDQSLETNHISDNSIRSTTELNTKDSNAEAVFSRNSNENERVKSNSPTLKIQNGLDRDSWQDVSNDLPQNTTEVNIINEDSGDSSKIDYGRSMFKNPEDGNNEGEEEITTLPPPHIANNIDFNDQDEGEEQQKLGKIKKPKFINDNSTNAQQMNLPNTSEAWTLAGLKPMGMPSTATMETAPKHKEDFEKPQNGSVDKTVNTVSKIPLLNNGGQSEKYLLDWSHIINDKDLVATTEVSGMTDTNTNTLSEMNSLTHDTTTIGTGIITLGPSLNVETSTAGTITANSPNTSTILSSMSDNVEGGDKQDQHEKTTLTQSDGGGGGMIDAATGESSTEFTTNNKGISLFTTTTSSEEIVASPKSVITQENQQQQRPELNEINLTLNKTTTAVLPMAERENNIASNANADSDVKLNAFQVVTDTQAERVTETATAVSDDESLNTAKTLLQQQQPQQQTIINSTLETGKVNGTTTPVNVETNVILENSQNYQENRLTDNENSLKQNGKLQTIDAKIEITTYKPSFYGLTSTTHIPPLRLETTTTTTTNKIPLAEVVDQNGNNEIKQKQSINIETTEATLDNTTTESAEAIGASLNNFSSTIKTHFNEQVLLETTTESITGTNTITTSTTTTTTATPQDILVATTIATNGTSEEKTTSSSIDEIINGKNNKDKEELETFTNEKPTTTPKSIEEDEKVTIEGQENSIIIIGSTTSSPPTPETNTEKEVEIANTTTPTNSQQETPVVQSSQNTSNPTPNINENLIPLTTTTTTKTPLVEKEGEERQEEETTTESVGTYFKFPIKGGNKKETTTEQEPITETSDFNKTKDHDQEVETSTMSLPDNTSATQETIITTTSTAKEETYISLLDESTTTTSTTNAPPSPTTTTIPIIAENPYHITTTNEGIDISSKIEEIYKVITSSSTTTESIPTTTPISIEETSILPPTTTTTLNTLFIDSTSIRTNLNMLPSTTSSTTPAPTINTADIGGGINSLPPLNSMYPKNTDASGETDVNVIIAITVSVIGVVALILLVAFLYLMRKRQKQTSYGGRCRPVSLDEYTIDNGSIGASMRKGSVLRSSKRTYGNLAFDDPSIRHNAMGLHELSKFAAEKLRIFEEFRDVPQITAREDEVPQGCEDKNRYANVLPLPETRVILQRLNDDEKTEYINANYVTGPKDSPNYYIACQAPMDTTVEDFWRMIWEQQSRVIIQATDLIENGVEKCAEYLPPSVTLDNHCSFGDFQVTLQNREVKDKYAISTILLKHTGENVSRELTHYWYKWPETGVPSEEAPIIAMLLEARSSLISYAIEQANEDKDKEKSSSATLKSAEEGTANAMVNGGSSGKEGTDVDGNGEINGNISMVPIKKTARNQGYWSNGYNHRL